VQLANCHLFQISQTRNDIIVMLTDKNMQIGRRCRPISVRLDNRHSALIVYCLH